MRSSTLATLANEPEWLLPMTLPNGWVRVKKDMAFSDEEGAMSTAAVFVGPGGLKVIVSDPPENHPDGRQWVHASISKKGQLPNWQELKTVKSIFFGPDRLVMQIFPPEAEYVNVMPTCLHLWHCLDVPDDVPMGLPVFFRDQLRMEEET